MWIYICRANHLLSKILAQGFACGILGAIAFALSAFGLGIGIIVILLVVASIIVGIIDIAPMDSEIPHKHSGMVIGLVLDAFLIFVTLFL